jgi:hypothetical protein
MFCFNNAKINRYKPLKTDINKPNQESFRHLVMVENACKFGTKSQPRVNHNKKSAYTI